jgi:hypothetical protein
MVARVLIAQDANGAPGPQQLNNRLKSFFAVEKLETIPAADLVQMGVDVTIAEPLIDARVPNVADEFRRDVGEKFPRSEMTQDEHDRHAGSELPIHCLDVLDLDVLKDFIDRHVRQLHAAQQIRAKPLKMVTHEATQLAGRFLLAEGNCDILPCEPAIATEQQPAEKARPISNGVKHTQRQSGQRRCFDAVEKINEIIEHLESAWNAAPPGVVS